MMLIFSGSLGYFIKEPSRFNDIGEGIKELKGITIDRWFEKEGDSPPRENGGEEPEEGSPITIFITSVLSGMSMLYAGWRGFKAFGVNPASLMTSMVSGSRMKDLEAQAGFRHKFAMEFHDVTRALNPRTMLILIDDLDRCKPENPRAAPIGPLGTPAPPVRGRGVRTVVVDPGHGGDETGAIGPSGTMEKDLTLAIARELAERLRATLGLQVVLTRDEDIAVALDARSALANQQKADLFLSVHLNATVAGRARGAETYFLSLQATDERAAGLAETESLTGGAPASPGSGAFDLQLLLWDLAQSRHLASSQRLATFIQEEPNRALELPDRGVKQAPFRVLTGAAMPAVLVELGFLSNAEEEKRLRDPVYRSGLAETLVRAVARFKSELEGAASRA